MEIPFFKEIRAHQNILISGCGGGFDIAHGIFLYLYLKERGHNVTLANFSFTYLDQTECIEIKAGCFEVTRSSSFKQNHEINYFPEKYILEWLYEMYQIEEKMYAFSFDLGVVPLKENYQFIIDKHNIDAVILVDGGTDSLMFGDESNNGTMVEDVGSILAATETTVPTQYLMSIGFGTEHHYGLNHYDCLENMALFIKEKGFKGCVSITNTMKEGQDYLDMGNYVNQKQQHQSVIVNSVMSAMQGGYGNLSLFYEENQKNESGFYINPLMLICWFYDTHVIANHIKFRTKALQTMTNRDLSQVYRLYRAMNKLRIDQKIPLS